MGSVNFNRAEIDAVALRNGATSNLVYLTKLVKLDSLTTKIENFRHEVYNGNQGLINFFGNTYTASKVSASEIKLVNSEGYYVTFKGAHFGPITSTGSLTQKFESLKQAIQTFDANADARLDSITYGKGSTVLGSATLTSTQLSVTAGKAAIVVDGVFPTSLGDVYTAIDQMLGLDKATPVPDPSTFKFLAIPTNSPLFNYDLNKITVKYNGSTFAKATFTDSAVTVSGAGVIVTATGAFPDTFGELYNAIIKGIGYSRSGHTQGEFPTFKLLSSLAANAKAHDYDLDSITIKKGAELLASATLTETKITITAGDFKLTANGSFPHTMADFMELLADLQGTGGSTHDLGITSLKLVDLHDNSTLVSGSSLSGAAAYNLIGDIYYAMTDRSSAYLSEGNDKFTGSDRYDFVSGFGGDDTIAGGGDKDSLYGDEGNDSLTGGADGDFLFGGDGHDKVYGEAGDDLLYGDAGSDTISGAGGNDTVTGGKGQDSLTGGSGADLYIFAKSDSAAATPDLITDFKSVDRIQFDNYDNEILKFDTGGTFAKSEIKQTVVGSDLKLEFNFDSDADAEFVLVLKDHAAFTSIDDLIV